MGALGALLGLGPDGVRAAERRGQLPAAEETPGGHRRWDLRAVAAFLERKGRAVPARLAAAIGGGASIPPEASPTAASPPSPPIPPPAPGPYRVEVPPGGASIGGVIVTEPGAYMVWPGKLPAEVVSGIQAIPAAKPAPAPAPDPLDTAEDDGADAFIEEVRLAAAAAIEAEVGCPPARLPVADLVVQALPRWAGLAPHELRLGHVRGAARAARELADALEQIVRLPRGASARPVDGAVP